MLQNVSYASLKVTALVWEIIYTAQSGVVGVQVKVTEKRSAYCRNENVIKLLCITATTF